MRNNDDVLTIAGNEIDYLRIFEIFIGSLDSLVLVALSNVF